MGNDLHSVDFARMKMLHSTWGLRLRGFLLGNRENVDSADLVSYQDCDLGKWIYAAGLTKYGHLPAMQALETKHKFMHDMVRRTVNLKLTGKLQDPEQEFMRIYEVSKSVVALISDVEQAMQCASQEA